MAKWIYYEIQNRRGNNVGILRCPHCVNTLTWRTYNEFLKGMRYCPFCGERLEGIEDEQEEGQETEE